MLAEAGEKSIAPHCFIVLPYFLNRSSKVEDCLIFIFLGIFFINSFLLEPYNKIALIADFFKILPIFAYDRFLFRPPIISRSGYTALMAAIVASGLVEAESLYTAGLFLIFWILNGTPLKFPMVFNMVFSDIFIICPILAAK